MFRMAPPITPAEDHPLKTLSQCEAVRGSVRRSAWLVALLAATLPVATMLGLDPARKIHQYGHDVWTSTRGLPGEAVYQILQSRDGYLWMRTSAGLVRFDGVRFTTMDTVIGSEPVQAICIGADGDLLIRTTTRTVVYKDGVFSDYRLRAALPDGGIRSIFETKAHEVLIGSDNFVYRLDKNGPTLIRDAAGWVNSILEDSRGTVWIGAGPTLYRYRDGKVPKSLDVKGIRAVFPVIEDHAGNIWIGANHGVLHSNAHGTDFKMVAGQAIQSQVNSLIEDREHNVWVGTNESGLMRICNGQIDSFRATAGLTDDRVYSLFEDREGSMWVGTATGLERFRNTRMTNYTVRDGLMSDSTRSAIATADGAILVRSDDGGLSMIRDGKVTQLTQRTPGKPAYGQALLQSMDGSIWTGKDDRGVTRIQNGKETVYAGGGHLAKHSISAIAEDREGIIVATSAVDVMRLKDGKLLPFTVRGRNTAFTKPGIYAFTIYCDPAGTLWFGTPLGLFKVVPGDDPAEELRTGIHFPVTSISDDGHGSLWLGGRSPGLTRFRTSDERVTNYRAKDGLFDGYLSRALRDDHGDLWISTSHGIVRANGQDLDDFADGHIATVRTTVYEIADGMKTSEASAPGSQPGGARTRDGTLWFTTTKGIVSVDPNHLQHNDLAPPVVLEEIVVNGHALPMANGLAIAPGTHQIEFHYAALSLSIPERVTFRYKLEGYDRDWVDAGTRRVAYYMNLPPGAYRFRVIAANEDGVWNGAGATRSFRLLPRFYQTRWFVCLCGLVAVLLAMSASGLYTRVIRARAKRLSQLVARRTVELQRSKAELEHLAHFDALTELPNRRKFSVDFGAMCIRPVEETFCLLLIDFDRFKAINDTFGHDAGDAFLVEASQRLRAAIRAGDRVARLGGDEFAILLSGEHTEDGVVRVCNRIVQSFASDVPFHGIRLTASASIGVASFPQHGCTQEEIYKCADLALYEAKRMGRNMWQAYQPELQGQRAH